MSALLDEQRGLLEQLDKPRRAERAGRSFWCGHWFGHKVVLVLSKLGKVAAASTATTLIEAFDVKRIVFTGVAGGIGAGIKVGDVVVADQFIQHDMDCSPLFKRFEIPLYARSTLTCDETLSASLLEAARVGLVKASEHFLEEYLVEAPSLHKGLIASGDQFISSAAQADRLFKDLKAAGFDALAVEMEGAAVAQVCADYGVPFAAVRTISDRADDQAHVDFSAFVSQVASPSARAILQQFVKML